MALPLFAALNSKKPADKSAKMGISTYGKPFALLLSLWLLRPFAMVHSTLTRATQCPFSNVNSVTTLISRPASPSAPAGTTCRLFVLDVSTPRKTSSPSAMKSVAWSAFITPGEPDRAAIPRTRPGPTSGVGRRHPAIHPASPGKRAPTTHRARAPLPISSLPINSTPEKAAAPIRCYINSNRRQEKSAFSSG